MDNHLNQNLNSSQDLHCLATSHLPEDHIDKFSGSMRKKMSLSYRQLMAPSSSGVAPTPERTHQDVHQVLKSMMMVYEANGTMINENKNRGKKYISIEKRNGGTNWGGKRKNNKSTH